MDKIEKLLKSANYEDNYIGCKILDELPKRKATAILRKIAQKVTDEYNYAGDWTIQRTEIELPDSPSDRSNYIKGKNYYYLIAEDEIFVDLEKNFRICMDNWGYEYDKIQESWK